jgi:uncharacterized protein YjbJ (UPF0337 family)
MDWKEIEKHWKQFERMLNYKWKLLTKDELQEINGSKTMLNTKLQGHYGLNKTDTNGQINDFLNTFQGILKGKVKISKTGSDNSTVTESKSS